LNQADEVLAVASFNPKVRWYWLLSATIVMVLIVVGIPLVPFYWLIGIFVTQRYLDRLECVLTRKSLRVKRGLLVREEKTIPLDKITDVGLVEGPVMRWLDLQALSVETAGQTGRQGGALVRLTGIVDTRGFRDRILQARDDLTAPHSGGGELAAPGATPTLPPSVEGGEVVSVLREIRGVLERVEAGLNNRDAPS